MQKNLILAFLIAVTLATVSPALAEKPSWASGGDKGGKDEQKKSRDTNGDREEGFSQNHRGDDLNGHIYFGEQHRNTIRNYYTEQFRSGHCPPGLAKKKNGCQPPGQTRKWQLGRQLPRDVIFYDLPPAIAVQLGPPPAKHRFVRVASDILMIAVGTGMVIDAIQDIGGELH
jgi:Ni/Co efflux regulator RcnB